MVEQKISEYKDKIWTLENNIANLKLDITNLKKNNRTYDKIIVLGNTLTREEDKSHINSEIETLRTLNTNEIDYTTLRIDNAKKLIKDYQKSIKELERIQSKYETITSNIQPTSIMEMDSAEEVQQNV